MAFELNEKRLITTAYRMCLANYDKKKMAHAQRVADYAAEIALRDADFARHSYTETDAYVTGLLHDLLEDTHCSFDEFYSTFPSHITEAVTILTKEDDETYDQYIDRVLESENILAFDVKKADMKDHLALKDTLTDKLKAKYFPHIAKFLV
jgi:(p)ppGpp synthase/HD superfamily hydrolase